MATGTDKRSKALHNFTMPCNLRWGNQKFLRCMKVNGSSSDAGQISTPRSTADHRHRTARDGRACKDHSPDDQFPRRSPKLGPTEGRRRFDDDGGDDGIAAVRQKVMLDLQTAADKMKSAIFKDGLEKGEVFISPPPDGEINRPWNLRTRRAACKNGGGASAASADGGGKGSVIPDMKVAAAAVSNKLPIQRSGGGAAAAAAAASGEKRERAKLSVPLSKLEIEEDFLAMVGHRPPRRPKKRARTIQKQIDMVFPGLWLTEVTPDMYKVDEAAP